MNRQIQETVKKLAGALPPLLRLQISERAEPITENSDTVVSNVLHYMIDGLVRIANKAPVIHTFLHANVHNAFLDALYDKNSVVDDTIKKIRPFDQELQIWAKPVSMMYDTPFHLCFMLQEPTEETKKKGKRTEQSTDAKDSTILYFLRAAHDPSLLVPVDKALKVSRQVKKIFQDHNFDPHEYLLYAFGRASRISSEGAASLKGSIPALWGGSRHLTSVIFLCIVYLLCRIQGLMLLFLLGVFMGRLPMHQLRRVQQ